MNIQLFKIFFYKNLFIFKSNNKFPKFITYNKN